MGGFSLPCLQTMSSVLAVRAVIDLVDSDEYPGKALLQYFLGTSRSLFYDAHIAGPSAEQPPPFYAYVIKTLRNLQSSLPSLSFRESTASEVCEKLAITQLDNQQIGRSRGVRWHQLTSAALPADVRDFGWLRGWEVLPTCDRLARFGVVRSARCPHCGHTETSEHALFHCRVAATFWTVLSRMFGLTLRMNTRSNDVLVNFLMCAGAFVLWRNRGAACLRARPQRAMFPLLWRVRSILMSHLEHELAALGEEAFLLRWSTRFIVVRSNILSVSLVPY